MSSSTNKSLFSFACFFCHPVRYWRGQDLLINKYDVYLIVFWAWWLERIHLPVVQFYWILADNNRQTIDRGIHKHKRRYSFFLFNSPPLFFFGKTWCLHYPQLQRFQFSVLHRTVVWSNWSLWTVPNTYSTVLWRGKRSTADLYQSKRTVLIAICDLQSITMLDRNCIHRSINCKKKSPLERYHALRWLFFKVHWLCFE